MYNIYILLHTYTYIYIYIYEAGVAPERERSLTEGLLAEALRAGILCPDDLHGVWSGFQAMHIHIYIYIYICTHTHIYIYMYQERERERDREIQIHIYWLVF